MRPSPKEMWEGRDESDEEFGHTVTSVNLAKSGMTKASRLAARREAYTPDRVGREVVRPVLEGSLHTGDGAVVQVIATPTA
jgi:hypothetical protein